MNKAAAGSKSPRTKPKKALGESLEDFQPLSKAERQLLAAGREGYLCELGDEVPEAKRSDNAIRPDLIRFLALGGDDQAPVHPLGVLLLGAWIDGDIDLDYCTCPRPLLLAACNIAGNLSAIQAHLSGLTLPGSHIIGLNGDRLRVLGDLFLNSGFKASGEMRLTGAQIDGNLECAGGSFWPREGYALSCDGAVVKGSVFLNDSFKASSTVRLLGAQIGGNLTCAGGTFTPKEGDALLCDRAALKGSVFLNGGFKASGTVRLLGAQIDGNLTCASATFAPEKGDALTCDGAVVKGTLFFRKVTAVTGAIDLTACTVGTLADDAASWTLVPNLGFDGFRYGRIVSGPTDAATRIAWLKRPQLAGYEKEFWPQPWEQLTKVLRDMGHEEDAKLVAMAKQDEMRAQGKIRPIARPFHALFGLLAGYGYKPSRTVKWMVATWLVCSWFYAVAGIIGAMGPSDSITVERHAASCGKPLGSFHSIWTTCPDLPKEYSTFNAGLYSLDVILPLVDLQQERAWAPMVFEDDAKTSIWWGRVTRWVMWFEILFGWVASLLLVAVLSNLPKRD